MTAPRELSSLPPGVSPDDLLAVCDLVVAMRAAYGPGIRPILERLATSPRTWAWVESKATERVGHC